MDGGTDCPGVPCRVRVICCSNFSNSSVRVRLRWDDMEDTRDMTGEIPRGVIVQCWSAVGLKLHSYSVEEQPPKTAEVNIPPLGLGAFARLLRRGAWRVARVRRDVPRGNTKYLQRDRAA